MALTISVVICTYNRAEYIYGVLQSLVKQDTPNCKYEIIVVNNNSTDNTEEEVNRFIKDNIDIPLIYVIEEKQGLSHARNKGIKTAKGSIIAFVDDDAEVRKDYIKKIAEYVSLYPKYYAMGGKVIPIFEEGKEPEWMSEYIERIVSKVDLGDKVKDFKKKYPVGCNMIFRKEIFNLIGYFNIDLNLRSDDRYIFNKIKAAKLKILYVPDVVVWHYIDKERTTKQSLIRISLLNGRSERIRLQKEGNIKVFFRFFDYLFRIVASVILLMLFFVKKEFIKGKYLFLVMFYSLKGFIFYNRVTEYKKKTVRQ